MSNPDYDVEKSIYERPYVAPLPPSEQYPGYSYISAKSVRKGFIHKVYGILSLQIALTVVWSAIAILVVPVQTFILSHMWLQWFFLALGLTTIILLSCFHKFARNTPWNYITLLLFTISQAYFVGSISAINEISGNGTLVVTAAGLTCIMVLALTIYAYTTKTDVTMWGGILVCVSIGLLIFVLLAVWLRSNWLYIALCSCLVVLFGIFLVYDTQLIIGKKRHQLSEDDYILGALMLYLDIILIFTYILDVLRAVSNQS